MVKEQALDDGLQEKHLRWLGIIQDSGHNIQLMLESLSELFKLSHQVDHKEVIHLCELLESVFNEQKEYEGKGHAKLDVHVTGDWPESFEGSPALWEKLLASLLQNALRFQPKAAEHVIQIKVSFVISRSKIIMTIEDNGIGTTDIQREEMLRPFKRLNRIEDYPGVGMGLTYCSYIAELHKATLTFEKSNTDGLKVIYTHPLGEE
jgi:signal transduction histidine kinase